MDIKFTVKALSLVFLTQISFPSVEAALPKAQVPTSVKRQIGGQAGSGFSLLDLHRVESKGGTKERLIFSIGNRDGKSLKGPPGYFNVQNQKNRIIVDFSQMPTSRLSEKALRDALKNSKNVKTIKLVQDPLDQTLTLILDLKGPVKMRTLQVKGQKQTARVVLDIIKQ